jgi:hypothetical protein
MKQPHSSCLACKAEHQRATFEQSHRRSDLTLFRCTVAKLEQALVTDLCYFDGFTCRHSRDFQSTMETVMLFINQANANQGPVKAPLGSRQYVVLGTALPGRS